MIWDAVYFERIAQCGHEHEQCHAFFPGLPRLVALVASVAGPAWEALLRPLALIGISCASFIAAAVLLYMCAATPCSH